MKLLFVCIVFCSTNGLVGGPDGFSHRFGGMGALWGEMERNDKNVDKLRGAEMGRDCVAKVMQLFKKAWGTE